MLLDNTNVSAMFVATHFIINHMMVIECKKDVLLVMW